MAYDLMMLGLLAVTTMRGAAKGMAWQLAGIAALLLCFVFATPLSAAIAPQIPLQAPLNRWVAMLAIYLLFSFASFTIARSFRGFLESNRFEEFDRHLGALFGFIKGITICFMLTFFSVCFSDAAAAYILPTKTGFIATRVMQQIEPVLPTELLNVLRKAAGEPELGLQPLPQEQEPDLFSRGPAVRSEGAAGSFDVWNEQDTGTPEFTPNRNVPPRSSVPPKSALPPANPKVPSRGDFFRSAGGNSLAQPNVAAPPVGGGISDLLTSGNFAQKALGTLQNLMRGTTPQPTATTPPRTSSTNAPAPSPPPAATPLATIPRSREFESDPFTVPVEPNSLRNGANSSPETRGIATAVPSLDEEEAFTDLRARSRPATSGPANTAVAPRREMSLAPLPSQEKIPSLPHDEEDEVPQIRDVARSAIPSSRLNSPPLLAGDEPPMNAPSADRIREERLLPDERQPISGLLPSPAVRGVSAQNAPAPTWPVGRRDLSSEKAPVHPADIASRQGESDLKDRALGTSWPQARPANAIAEPVPAGGGHRSVSHSTASRRGGRDRTAEIETLISGILILIASPADRPARETMIRQELSRYPQDVVSAVLRDWQADLLGTNRDPNSTTDVSTPLETRIQGVLNWKSNSRKTRPATPVDFRP